MEDLTHLSTDALEQFLVRSERAIAKVRANQMAVLGEIDRRQVPLGDGCHSLREWVAGRMDLAPENAATLARTTKVLSERPNLATAISNGSVGYDRTAELTRGGDDDPSWHLDIAGLRRRRARQRRLTRTDEETAFRNRYLTFQATLDGASGRLHGELPAVAFRTVERAIDDRADTFRPLPDGYRPTRGQRHADALVGMAQDSLDRDAGSPTGSSEPAGRSQVTLFVDATDTTRPTGASVEYGPRVGPIALETALCTGAVQVVGIADGQPIAATDSTSKIPPGVRRFVAWRDGACAADGCTSRYRLEPHHVRQRSAGGDNHPDNLRTLCWYHHHVVVHGGGYRIDPDSPIGRTRFLGTGRRRAPP